MRRENLLLGIVCIVSVIGAHLLASHLRVTQREISKSRSMVAKIPLAGFHKFAADVYWMLFLQYAGANEVNKTNVAEYEKRINEIIELDPNFVRIYHEGALMLHPIDHDRALTLLDRGIKHPEFSQNWRLPMLAGQLIMRRQWDRYYSDQEMDLHEVERAKNYYKIAIKASGSQGTAINSYVRVCAALGDATKTREYNELLEWYNFWQDNRRNQESFGFGMSEDGGSDASPFSDRQDFGAPFDMGEKIISVMRKARAKSPNDDETNKLIEQVKNRIFPGVRFNEITLEPIMMGAVSIVDGRVDNVRAMPYTILLRAPAEITILSLTGRTTGGEVKTTLLINGAPVEGLTDVVYGGDMVMYEAVKANMVPPGAMVELQIVEATEGASFAYQVECYFSQSR